jgi:hypothetical protein
MLHVHKRIKERVQYFFLFAGNFFPYLKSVAKLHFD